MKRRLLNLPAAVSLLLLAAVTVLWVRSYRVTDEWVWRRVDADARRLHELYVHSGTGRLRVSRHELRISDDFYASPHDMARLKGSGGLWHSSGRPGLGSPVRRHIMAAPHWLFLPPLAVLPAAVASRRWTCRRRDALGLCAACGYDLRATPGRCPECGKVAAAGADA
jgi:hypothetical protein